MEKTTYKETSNFCLPSLFGVVIA